MVGPLRQNLNMLFSFYLVVFNTFSYHTSTEHLIYIGHNQIIPVRFFCLMSQVCSSTFGLNLFGLTSFRTFALLYN
uniref:Putative ovule protein n=1 Tax=Solanum chacoense TaxID=4108 RepID=A0A0V0IC23_SOLCH